MMKKLNFREIILGIVALVSSTLWIFELQQKEAYKEQLAKAEYKISSLQNKITHLEATVDSLKKAKEQLASAINAVANKSTIIPEEAINAPDAISNFLYAATIVVCAVVACSIGVSVFNKISNHIGSSNDVSNLTKISKDNVVEPIVTKTQAELDHVLELACKEILSTEKLAETVASNSEVIEVATEIIRKASGDS